MKDFDKLLDIEFKEMVLTLVRIRAIIRIYQNAERS